jgi:NitT/TauT family transport system permease protein
MKTLVSARQVVDYDFRIKKDQVKVFLPVLVVGVALGVSLGLPDVPEHPVATHHYFAGVLLILGAFALGAAAISWLSAKFKQVYQVKAPFYAGVVLFLALVDLLTVKSATLPVLYFPSLDRIFGVLIEDAAFLGKCLLYSLRLQVIGWIGGVLAGVVTGVAIGFIPGVRYWVHPLVRILGPIPSTAWIPLVLVSFPSVVSASAFLIALAVWFPTTVLTMNGINNIQNAYFEVAATMGASQRYTIFHVGIPAAMPHMFIGIFNGTCASFITLVTAELIGAKYGIGWYINWQKDMMAYAHVYAGLLVMSLICYFIITLLFKVRDKVLVWQKGVIKW